ncbi:MAG TPA: aminotransferase DegT, partial [Alphaproteobacteria bacterium]|nr:aminotransferase DegT [Alphaproteobacteria bacterium]
AGLPAALSAGRASGARIVGIIGVGLFGQPADYDAINAFAAAEGLWVIDDAAQSFGASWNGAKVGTLASMTCTSFFPAKPLGCYGDGGAVFTDDDDEAEIMRSCRIHGMGKTRYEYDRIGMTARLDAMQAVILDAKLDIFEEELTMRQQVANQYADRLAHLAEVPQLASQATSSWAQYTVKLPAGCDRAIVMKTLADHDVPSAIYYPVPMHRQSPYSSYPVSADGLQITATLCGQVLALPMHPYLEAATQDHIAGALATAIAAGSASAATG